MQNLSDIRLAMCQYDFTVGDLAGNKEKILQGIAKAVEKKCNVVTFPELSITGYPPEDLLMRKQFITDQMEVLQSIVSKVDDLVCIVGFVDAIDDNLYNSAAVIQNGSLCQVYHKIQLPNYSVFDEERYFEAGNEPLVISVNGAQLGIGICEDIWVPESVTESQAFCGGAEILVNISASPYYMLKFNERLEMVKKRAKRCQAWVLYNNLVGGQDELVFDGHSLIVDEAGSLVGHGHAFKEDMLFVDIDVNRIREHRKQDDRFETDVKSFNCLFNGLRRVELKTQSVEHEKSINTIERPRLCDEDEVYQALLLGLGDYVRKNGFKEVVFGLSGGIDSALVAALAADALGPENVHCVTLPTRYSSKGSVDDSFQLAENFGIKLNELAIENVFNSYLELLQPMFKGHPFNVAEENLQARIRGAIVMALSNKFGWIALATGNKSEVSVGYSTIYGDMVGGFSPLKDVYKMWVYKLSRRRNEIAGYDIIPQSIIDKAPSAELRPDQKDEDSLPPYDILDAILEYYVEDDMSIDAIETEGFDRQIIKDVIRLVDINEYKRRQAAPGVKITPRAFGKDRRMPITNKYRMK